MTSMVPVLESDQSDLDHRQNSKPIDGGDQARSEGTRGATHSLVTGTSALALGVLLERGAGFVANILAARLGGAQTFGAYSLAISTANNIATYAGAGIGSTAARFSGKYPYHSSGYATLARVLALVSTISALAAGLGLWLGAKPISTLLGQPGLVSLLRWSALSAMGIVLLECARGFFVGQRRLTALILMSILVGLGMLVLVPLAANHHDPIRMITSQGLVTTSAVLICLLLARQLNLFSIRKASSVRFGAVLREVWGFGLMQLAGLAGANAAGWWLVTLVARSDTSLAQIGFFGIASQLRNMVGLAPGLLTEGSLAVMADPDGEVAGTPQRVLGFTTYTASVISYVVASIGIIIAPWMLRLLYSAAYSNAAAAVSFALALAVMHMGNAPASARLSILSVRASGIINGIWAIVVAGAGTLIMSQKGSAATAMIVYFIAHTLSSLLVLVTLARRRALPVGLVPVFSLTSLSSVALACLATVRMSFSEQGLLLTAVMVLLAASSFAVLLKLGFQHRWVPSRYLLQRLALLCKSSLIDFKRGGANGA